MVTVDGYLGNHDHDYHPTTGGISGLESDDSPERKMFILKPISSEDRLRAGLSSVNDDLLLVLVL